VGKCEGTDANVGLYLGAMLFCFDSSTLHHQDCDRVPQHGEKIFVKDGYHEVCVPTGE
jgi:hypothetical protein